MSLFLGMDAGGTKTECAIADDDKILARAQSGSIKITRVTREQARQNLHVLLSEAAGRAKVSLNQICATCAGSSGFSVPEIGDWLRTSLNELVSGPTILCGDDEIALDAAFPGASGVMVIAGTGSNTVARTSTGERTNVGGWGPVLSDEGSGFWIGHQGLRAAMRAWDRGERSLLLERTAAHWQVNGLWEMVERTGAIPPPDFAALAPIVNACAEEGDAVCLEILVSAGEHLAENAVLAFRKMRSMETNPSTIAGVAFTGSVLRSSSIVRERMIEGIRRQLPTIRIVPQAVEPLDGALWRARMAYAGSPLAEHRSR